MEAAAPVGQPGRHRVGIAGEALRPEERGEPFKQRAGRIVHCTADRRPCRRGQLIACSSAPVNAGPTWSTADDIWRAPPPCCCSSSAEARNGARRHPPRARSPCATSRSSSASRAAPASSTPAGASLIQWRESRGPRCVSASRLVGATLLREDSVDLILRDNSRIRARLQSSCPALDYYRGFYINATDDGRICADRDAIRSRAGGECEIEEFSLLSPEPHPDDNRAFDLAIRPALLDKATGFAHGLAQAASP